MVDLALIRTLAEAANRPAPQRGDYGGTHPGFFRYADDTEAWFAAVGAYLKAVSDPAVVLALLAVVEAAQKMAESGATLIHAPCCARRRGATFDDARDGECICGVEDLDIAVDALTEGGTDGR